MRLRKYQTKDCFELSQLFFDTIHHINSKDYNENQINAWGTKDIDLQAWDEKYKSSYSIVAEHKNLIVGFSNLYSDGLLDMMFVHKDYQQLGIASLLLNALETHAKINNIDIITSNVSITAKPFFLKHNYIVIKEQQVELKNVLFTNFKMEKRIN